MALTKIQKELAPDITTSIIGNAGDTLDTLEEVADAIGNDANFATNVSNSIALKLNKATTVITDWNDAIENGFYAGGSSTLNGPTADWYIGLVMVVDSNNIIQEVEEYTTGNSTDTKKYKREKKNGIWSNWYRLRLSEDELDARYVQGEFASKVGFSGNDPNVPFLERRSDGVAYALQRSLTDNAVLNKIKNVDGVGSGLDADLLDGQDGSYYAVATEVLNLTGGTLTGDLDLNSASPVLTLKDTSATGDSTVAYVKFVDSGDARQGYVGLGSATNPDVYLTSDSGNVTLTPSTGNKVIVNSYLWMPDLPSWYVWGPAGSYASGQIVPYQNTIHNNGSHYSSTTKAFTAPITGLYQVAWSAIGDANVGIYRYHLYKNGTNCPGVKHLRVSSTGTYGDGSASVVVPLDAGDYIQIYFISDEGNTSYGSTYEYFCGYLINATG